LLIATKYNKGGASYSFAQARSSPYYTFLNNLYRTRSKSRASYL